LLLIRQTPACQVALNRLTYDAIYGFNPLRHGLGACMPVGALWVRADSQQVIVKACPLIVAYADVFESQ
jgi:hypothetical protein